MTMSSSDHMSVLGFRGPQGVNDTNNIQLKASKSNGRSFSKVSSQDISSGVKSFLKTAGKILLLAAVITLGIAVFAGAVALPPLLIGVVLVALTLGVIAKTKSCAKRTIMPKTQDQIESQPKLKDSGQISRQQYRGPSQEETLLKKYGYASNAEDILKKGVDEMSDEEINLALEEKLLKDIEDRLHFLDLEDGSHAVDKLDKFAETGKYGALGSSGDDQPLVEMDKPFHKDLPQFFNEMVELRKILVKHDKVSKDEPKKSVISESEWNGISHRHNDFSKNNLVAYKQELGTYGRLLAKGIKNKKAELASKKAEESEVKTASDKIRVRNKERFDKLQAKVDLRSKELEDAD